MNLQSYYEDSFRMERGRDIGELYESSLMGAKPLYNYVLESKTRFLGAIPWNEINVLELGSGLGALGLQLAALGANVTLVDFSPTALELAEGIFQSKGFKGEFKLADLTHPDVSLEKKFDLIIDSHLLHCIITEPDRASYYKLINEHLSKRGIFVAETMVHRKKLHIPDGFMFDQNNTLWQMFGEWKPVRRILDSLDLEDELKRAGLEIIYFYYYGQYAFVPHRSFMEIPSEVLPAAVRFVIKKP